MVEVDASMEHFGCFPLRSFLFVVVVGVNGDLQDARPRDHVFGMAPYDTGNVDGASQRNVSAEALSAAEGRAAYVA